MRRLLLMIGTVAIAAGVSGVIAAAYFRHHNTSQINRAKALAADLQTLTVGTSDFKAARAIATRFGTVPYENDWGTRDCADGYFERCAYMIPLNSGVMRKLLLKHPFLSHLGVGDWSGTAHIYIENGTIKNSSLGIIYRASNGKLRGFAADEGISLPENRAVQARISDAYSVQRNDILTDEKPRDVGFELEASLTPMASAAERKRAWNLNFACLVQNQGCGEICDVMPDAWRDFYSGRGHFDVEKYGPAYLFCKNPPP
jgi:hypothetical protein